MLIISHSQVRDLLPMSDCMSAVGEALSALSRNEGLQPLRSGMLVPGRLGVLAWMPGSLASGRPFGIKVLSVFERAADFGLDSHQGGVMIFDPECGRPLALLEAGAITAVRTAAVSAVATDRLARTDATKLAILGSGTQARSHVGAMLAVRPLSSICLWSRSEANATRLADEQSALHDIEIEVVTNIEAAINGADIICTTTSAREPILAGELLRPGVHVNAVGASIPSMRELDTEAVRRSTLFTDRRESLANEAGEYIQALKQGAIAADHPVAEIGEVLNGDHPGRTSPHEITLFRSLGLAVEDLASAQLVYERALQNDIGVQIDFAE
jgi:alanine dehydrogenase